MDVNGCQWMSMLRWFMLISRLVECSKETANFIKLGAKFLLFCFSPVG